MLITKQPAKFHATLLSPRPYISAFILFFRDAFCSPPSGGIKGGFRRLCYYSCSTMDRPVQCSQTLFLAFNRPLPTTSILRSASFFLSPAHAPFPSSPPPLLKNYTGYVRCRRQGQARAPILSNGSFDRRLFKAGDINRR